ncbi:Tricalbin-2 [Rhizina undulata]
MEDQGVPPPGSAEDRRLTGKQEENIIARDARNGGAPTFQFDPDATPEQKAAQVRQAVPPELKLTAPGTQASTVVAVIDENGVETNGAVIPPPSKSPTNGNGVTASPTTGLSSPAVHKSSTMVNGFPKAGEGEWDRTGWTPRFGGLNDVLGVNNTIAPDHQTWVEANLDEKFYGDWYHNAGVIGFACISTWFLTKIGGGLGWVLIIMACCATYYRTSIRRVRRNVRDDLNREFAKARLATDVESLEWMNSFLVKFWPIYQPVLAATIVNTVDQVLATATPAFLDSLRLTTFTLGTKPPRVEHVKTYPKTEDDIVEMDWNFSFTPNDTGDLTSRQLKNKINPKIVLEVRIGKGIASKGIPIVVEDMAFSGTMKIKMKLQIAFPHIEKVDVCFMGRPSFDYVLKPLGGETFGIDIGFLPGLSGFIQEQIHGNLGPMFYAPNVFTVEVAKMLGGAPINSAIGVLCVTLHNAQALKNPDSFSGAAPDPYAVFSINNREELARTKIVHENANPRWNETKYFVITNFNDSLHMNIFDFNEFRKDKELGSAILALDRLQKEPELENLQLPILASGKTRGQVTFNVRFFPILEGRTLEDGTKEPPPESNTGIVRFTISQAKDLDASKTLSGHHSSYAVQLMNGREIHKTKIMKRTNNPIWEESKELLITNRKACKLGIILKDERDLAADPIIGTYDIKLNDLLDSVAKGNDWFDLVGTKTGRIKMTAHWSPVAIKGIIGTGGYITPIGVMRLHFQSGRDLRNLEAVGKSDPYVRVLLSGIEKAKTVTFNNDLNPDWDEVLYIPVHSPKEKLSLEVMDQENMGKDRSLGAFELSCEEYVKEGSNGQYLEHSVRTNRSEGLILAKKGTPKGTLQFNISFYPCLNVADPEEEEEERKLKQIEHEEAKEAHAAEKEITNNTPKDVIDVENEKANTGEADKQIDVQPPRKSTSSDEESVKKPPKVKLTPEELVKHDSGFLIFKIIEGNLSHKDCHLEIVMDDMLFPAYSTAKIRSKHMKFDEIGDAFVRELEFSRLTLRLKEHGKDSEAEEIAKLTGNTMETLKQCLNNPTILTLRDKDGELSKIKISLKYIPVLMKLDPSESINNMGTLRVDVMDAANVLSADRNGKSDPFCVFELDDKEVHKTKVQKKTLHPAWNEVFETKVASRTGADFKVEVFDWDIGSKADFLGKTPIDLSVLEPFVPKTITYQLLNKQGQEGKYGEIRLRMLFKPDYVVRSRQGSSTFHGTFATPGKIVTGVAGAPLKVGGFAAGGITKGASFIKKNTFGRVKSKENSNIAEESESDMDEVSKVISSGGGMKATGDGAMNPVEGDGKQTSLDGFAEDSDRDRERERLSPGQRTPKRGLSPTAALGGTSPHARTRSASSNVSMTGLPSPGADHGTATVRLVSASGFPTNANVQIRIKTADKLKELHKSKSIKSSSGEIEWNESFNFNCTADQQFKLFAKDNHLLRGDEELGEALFVVDDTGTGQDTVLSVGQGRIVLRTSFKSLESGSNDSPKSVRKGLFQK